MPPSDLSPLSSAETFGADTRSSSRRRGLEQFGDALQGQPGGIPEIDQRLLTTRGTGERLYFASERGRQLLQAP
ncbi:hypothetical protein NKH18_27370 [Streptomyces sp. M10(2022)]